MSIRGGSTVRIGWISKFSSRTSENPQDEVWGKHEPQVPWFSSDTISRRPYRYAEVSVREAILLEDDGPYAVNQDPVLQVPADGAGEDPALHLASEADEIFDRVAMRNVGDVLVNYRARIELLGDVVGRSPDGLHTPLMRPAVGVGSCEGRQERM